MALTLNKGKDAIRTAAERSGGGKWMPTLKWEANETKYIQLVTPLDECPTVLMHALLCTGFREDGSKKYDTFISRKDPAIDGPEGYDGFMEKFSESPKPKTIGLAVEMVPVIEKQGNRNVTVGFEVAEREFTTKEEETKTVPNVGLLVQSPSNFFSHLTVLSDMTPLDGKILAVARTGKSTDTTYTFAGVADGLSQADLDAIVEEVGFDFDAQLEEWADEDNMRMIVDALPADFVVNQFSKRGKGKDAAKAASTGRTTRAAAVEEPVADGDGEEAPAAPRSRRFASLKQEIGATTADAAAEPAAA